MNFLDYCSIYQAVLNQLDPSPINSINFVKKRLYNCKLIKYIIKCKISSK